MSKWKVISSKHSDKKYSLIDYKLECGLCGRSLDITLKDNVDISKIKCECEIVSDPKVKSDYDRNIDTKLYRFWVRNSDNMCDLWGIDFDNFKIWCYQNGYKAWLMLKRLDNNEPYGPDNCVWVSRGKIMDIPIIEGDSVVDKSVTVRLINNSNVRLNSMYNEINNELEELELLSKSSSLTGDVDIANLIKDIKTIRNKLNRSIKEINKIDIK